MVECGVCTAVVTGVQWAVENGDSVEAIEEFAKA